MYQWFTWNYIRIHIHGSDAEFHVRSSLSALSSAYLLRTMSIKIHFVHSYIWYAYDDIKYYKKKILLLILSNYVMKHFIYKVSSKLELNSNINLRETIEIVLFSFEYNDIIKACLMFVKLKLECIIQNWKYKNQSSDTYFKI